MPSPFQKIVDKCYADLECPPVTFESFSEVYCILCDRVDAAIPLNVITSLNQSIFSELEEDGDFEFSLAQLNALELDTRNVVEVYEDEEDIDGEEEEDVVTCLHSLQLPIRVLLIPPPLCSSEDLTFTIKQSTPFPIDSRPVPYHYMVPYPRRLSDIICCSRSVQVHFRSASLCLVPCSTPLPSLLCSFSLSNP